MRELTHEEAQSSVSQLYRIDEHVLLKTLGLSRNSLSSSFRHKIYCPGKEVLRLEGEG
jgi:hypothetical protein